MKRQIIMTMISLYSLTWAMEHKAEQPLFKPTPPQHIEREHEANLLLPKLPGHATRNTTSLHQSSLFKVHRAKL
jgi:hypothetical protein